MGAEGSTLMRERKSAMITQMRKIAESYHVGLRAISRRTAKNIKKR